MGRGAQGEVFAAYHRDGGPKVALKFLKLHEVTRETVKYAVREVYNQYKLNNHDHIIQLYDVWVHEGQLVLQMEYADGGTLAELCNRYYPEGMPEELALDYFRCILCGVHYCHIKRIYNRDIKLQNVLMCSVASSGPGRGPGFLPKLSDFGFSKDGDFDSFVKSIVGTPLYAAPEVLENASLAPQDGEKIDTWCLGVVLYTMLLGRNPFVYPTDSSLCSEKQKIAWNDVMRTRITRCQVYPIPAEKGLSAEVQDLIAQLLRRGATCICVHIYTIDLPPCVAYVDEVIASYVPT